MFQSITYPCCDLKGLGKLVQEHQTLTDRVTSSSTRINIRIYDALCVYPSKCWFKGSAPWGPWRKFWVQQLTVPFPGIVSDITSFWSATTVQLTGPPQRSSVMLESCQQKWQVSKGAFPWCLQVLQQSTDSQDSKEKHASLPVCGIAFDAKKMHPDLGWFLSSHVICKRIKTPMTEGTKWRFRGHDSKRPQSYSDIRPTSWPLVEGLNGGMQYATCFCEHWNEYILCLYIYNIWCVCNASI